MQARSVLEGREEVVAALGWAGNCRQAPNVARKRPESRATSLPDVNRISLEDRSHQFAVIRRRGCQIHDLNRVIGEVLLRSNYLFR